MTDDNFISDLEAVFAAVLAEARSNPSFARKIAASVGRGRSLKSSAKARTDWTAEAPGADLRKLLKAEGEESVRKTLRGLSQRAVYAWLKASGLNARNASKMNKTQLIEHVIRVLKKEAGSEGRRFEY
jgi:hypothetical protein